MPRSLSSLVLAATAMAWVATWAAADAAPLPPATAADRPATYAEALRQMRPSDALPSGLYALEPGLAFNTLDAVDYDAATGQISLVGRWDPRFAGPQIPYLQHLAALLDMRNAKGEISFSLETTAASRQNMRAKFAATGISQRAVLAHFTKIFDPRGVVTHLGAAILQSLGISPVQGHRPPGYFGAIVEGLPSGSVKVVAIVEGSPADNAALSAGDEIVRFNGRPTFSPTEFERLVRFGGSGNKATISYLRGGRPAEVTIGLVPDQVDDPMLQATRTDIDAWLLARAGQADRARIAYQLGVLAAHIGTPVRLAALKELGRLAGAEREIAEALAGTPANRPASAAVEAEVGRRALRRLDASFAIAGTPSAQAFDAELGRSRNIDAALRAALQAFESRTPATLERLSELARTGPNGFQLPPELVELLVGAHHESVPEYFGEASDTQLARLLLEVDYAVIKPLAHRTDLKGRLPGYQTLFDYAARNAQVRDGLGNYRIWLSVAKMDVAQSQGGNTLVIRGAAMRFNFVREGTPAAASPVQAYADMLTAQYDELAQDYFALHEVREAAKLAAVAAWIRQKTPAYRLPAAGRVVWTAPKQVPGISFMQMPRAGSDDIALVPHGGVNLTPFPLGNMGSVALVIPMDRGAPELGDVPNIRTPAPDIGRSALSETLGLPGAAPKPVGWTGPVLVGGRPGRAVTVQPGAFGNMTDLRDAPRDGDGRLVPKAAAEEAERALKAQIAQETNPVKKSYRMLELASLMSARGLQSEADKILQAMKDRAATSPPLLRGEAAIMERVGDRRGAIEALRLAVKLDPGNESTREWLSRLQAQDGRGLIMPPSDRSLRYDYHFGNRPPTSVPPPGGQAPGGQPPGGQPQGGALQGGVPPSGRPQGGAAQGGVPQAGSPQGGQTVVPMGNPNALTPGEAQAGGPTGQPRSHSPGRNLTGLGGGIAAQQNEGAIKGLLDGCFDGNGPSCNGPGLVYPTRKSSVMKLKPEFAQDPAAVEQLKRYNGELKQRQEQLIQIAPLERKPARTPDEDEKLRVLKVQYKANEESIQKDEKALEPKTMVMRE